MYVDIIASGVYTAVPASAAMLILFNTIVKTLFGDLKYATRAMSLILDIIVVEILQVSEAIKDRETYCVFTETEVMALKSTINIHAMVVTCRQQLYASLQKVTLAYSYISEYFTH